MHQNIKLHTDDTDTTDDHKLFSIDRQLNKSAIICLICVICVPISHYDTPSCKVIPGSRLLLTGF